MRSGPWKRSPAEPLIAVEEQDYRTTYELEGHNWWFVGMRQICLDLVAADGGPLPGPVLDVGCGTGIMLEHLPPGSFGLDASPTALRFCEARGRSGLVQGAGERLPFADDTFSLVTAIGVIEHIEADEAAMAEWARVLRPGGRLVFLTSAYRWLWSGHDVSNHHVRRYTSTEVEALVRSAGLTPTKTSYVNTFLFPVIAALRLLERAARRGRGFHARKDTGAVPGPINAALIRLLGLEAWCIRRGRLPFGVSMVASASKPS